MNAMIMRCIKCSGSCVQGRDRFPTTLVRSHLHFRSRLASLRTPAEGTCLPATLRIIWLTSKLAGLRSHTDELFWDYFMKFQYSAQRKGSIRKAHRANTQYTEYFRTTPTLTDCLAYIYDTVEKGLVLLLRTFAGVSLPSPGLRRLSPVWLLPGGFLLAVMWRRDGPVPVQAWRHWAPVQRMRQPICWGHKLRLWGWEGFSLWQFLTSMFFTTYEI